MTGVRVQILAHHHRDMLAASGIDDERAAARGYETVNDKGRLIDVQVAQAGRRVPGLLVPMRGIDGTVWGYQFRPDHPRADAKGKDVKYETPVRQRNGIDVPPGVGPKLADPTVPLWITEGVKKADCAAAQGLCCVALPGVWSWRGKNEHGGKTAIPDWHDIALNGRPVVLAFDGDVARKESVRQALRELAGYLERKGARVRYLHLPDTADKTGLDDYLVAHGVDGINQLVRPDPPPKADHLADPAGSDRLAGSDGSKGEGRPTTPIDGAELLDDMKRFAGQFLAFPTEHYLVVVVLWAAHTWAVKAFYVTPRLVLDSPEPGSGKTRVLEVLALLSRNAKLTLSTTTAALYRRIDAAGDQPPTVLQDEADAVFGKTANPQSEDLRALFNAGYKRGATVDRCEGDAKNMKVREFPVFAPVALAGLAGKMPATITDRAVTLHMRRRAPNEHVAEFRERDAATAVAPLRERLEAWATVSLDALAAARPAMPAGVRDRPAEVWEALLAVADVAGGDWPMRARAACGHFVLDTESDEKLSLGLRLLRDIKTVFEGRDRMFSDDVVAALTADPESEWRDLWGKPLDQRRLAKELKRYGVESQEVRIMATHRKGYVVGGDTGLSQAWHRYMDSTYVRDKRDKRNIAGQAVADVSRTERERDNRDTNATTKTAVDQQECESVAAVAAVADTDGTPGRTPGRDGRDEKPCCRDCGIPLERPASIDRGLCGECYLSANMPSVEGAS